MTKLVDELKSEHANLVNVLNEVKKLGITSNEGQQLLKSAKNGLIAHLQKEDRELYPQLRNAAKTDADLERTLRMFAQDMEGITTLALDFFNKYENGGSGIEFAKDFGRLFAMLGNRIGKEENILYAKYNEL